MAAYTGSRVLSMILRTLAPYVLVANLVAIPIIVPELQGGLPSKSRSTNEFGCSSKGVQAPAKHPLMQRRSPQPTAPVPVCPDDDICTEVPVYDLFWCPPKSIFEPRCAPDRDGQPGAPNYQQTKSRRKWICNGGAVFFWCGPERDNNVCCSGNDSMPSCVPASGSTGKECRL